MPVSIQEFVDHTCTIKASHPCDSAWLSLPVEADACGIVQTVGEGWLEWVLGAQDICQAIDRNSVFQGPLVSALNW